MGEYTGDTNAPRRCGRKIRYDRMADALDVLDRMIVSPDCIDPETLNAYQCLECGGYHVGHLAELRVWCQNVE